MIMGKTFDEFIRDCQKPEIRKHAEQIRKDIDTRRKYKAEILDNPSGMKLQAGDLYKAEVIEPAADQKKRQTGEGKKIIPIQKAKPKYTEKEKLERELKKCEIRHLVNKDNPGYDEKAYLKQKSDLIIQLATLKAGGSIKRTADGSLIEYRTATI